jgi:dTDP-4-dehydrorhamnose reductase
MKKILVTGSNGQLGMELQGFSKFKTGYDFMFTDRKTFSLGNKEQMSDFFRINKPDYCINCAAYTNVDGAESNTQLANSINNEAVGFLAKLTKEFDCKLIHISTDYVFNAKNDTPISEDCDAMFPLNTYGETKYKGEVNCVKNNGEAIIIRTSWVYSSFGNNFVKTMLRLMKERNSIKVVDDQIGSPTYGKDLADCILKIVEYNKWTPGVFHYSNRGSLSWFDFASKIKELSNLECEILPISSSEFITKAKRPLFSILETKKIQEVYKIKTFPYLDSLKHCISILLIGNNVDESVNNTNKKV